mmetsp:Transcript_45162/g.104649  ORF Transcript_45162/g.104649 Transcript_45162/m.104649 type:complete len:473 (+) Transcript_45162:112-1530(+)
MHTAARLILPAASLRGGGDGGQSLNFEDELRHAVSAACAEPMDEDVLEVVACTACEVIDGLKDGDSAETALQTAVGPILAEGGCSEQQRSFVIRALSDRAGSIAAGNLPDKQVTVPAAVSRAIPSCHNRWVSRAQVEQERAEEYLEERAERLAREQEDREAQEAALIELHDSKRRSKHRESVSGAVEPVPAPAEPDSDSESEDEVARSHRQALQRRLRELGEPITLFGETSDAREARLKHCEMCRDQDILASGSTNVMQILDRRLAQGVLAERDEDETTRKQKVPLAPLGITDQGMGSGAPDADGWDDDDDDLEEEESDIKAVTAWLRATLREWESELTARSQVEQHKADFKAEKNQFRQSKQYLKPLRRALKEGGIQRDIVRSIADIAGSCDRREYKQAKEAYMRLSIGNKAWPMGVTFVTFHDRPNRHIIGEEQAAHALDDETTRKYVQMVKRLITFCEGKWPVDPSLAA